MTVQASAPTPITLREPLPGDMSMVVHKQTILYTSEYGWDWSFEAMASRIAAEFIENFQPGLERGWIAVSNDEVVGSAFVVRSDDDTAKLRMLFVDNAVRGRGLGGRLVDECIAFARDAGYSRMILWTNDVLVSARRIYEARGFVLLEEEPHYSFGTDLVGQVWGRAL